MKKAIIYTLGILFTLLSCSEEKQEEPEIPGTPSDEIFLSVSPESLTFDENDASKNVVTVSSNTQWKATTSNATLKTDRTTGSSGETQITITDAPAGESCKLTISTVPQSNDEQVISREVTVRREATVVVPDRTIIYNNDFDREIAVKIPTGPTSTSSTAGKTVRARDRATKPTTR